MPSGYQISAEWSGLVRRSSSACLKYQIFQTKVDSSNAHVAVPGTRLPKTVTTGQLMSKARKA